MSSQGWVEKFEKLLKKYAKNVLFIMVFIQ